MRRPIVLPAIFLCVGIMAGNYLLSGISPLIIGIPFIFAVILLPAEMKKSIIWALAGFFLLIYFNNAMTGMEDKVGQEMTLNGSARYVTEGESSYGQEKHDFFLYTDSGVKIKIAYYGEVEKRLAGREVEVTGELEKPAGVRNPGCFDYSIYLKSRGVAYTMTADSLQIVNEEYKGIIERFLALTDKIRYDFSQEIKNVMDSRTAGVMKAMMFGVKDEMDDDIYNEFQKNGTAHLLAVSGLHMSLLYGILAVVLSAGRKKVTNITVILLLFIYAALSDFTPSIMRAFVMITVNIIGKLIHGRYDLMNSGAFSVLLLLFMNPYSLFHSGFQMSFLAIFIMAAALIRFKNIPMRKAVKNTLLPVLTIQSALSVYICYNFNYFSFTAFIANVPVTLISSWLLPMGIVALFMTLSIGYIPQFYGNLMEQVTDMMLKSNSYTYMEGIGTFDTVSPSIFTVMLFYGLFFMLLSEDFMISFSRRKYRRIASIIIVILVGCSFLQIAEKDGFENADVMFIDVGQGNCMLFKSEDGRTMLVDGGGSPAYDTGIKTVKPTLLKNGVKKIDVAVVTHLDNDHYLGIKSLAADGMIEKIAFYEGNKAIKDKLSEECNMETSNFIFLARGDRLQCGDNLTADIIAPDRKRPKEYQREYDAGDENIRSLVFKVNLDGLTFLVTGDIDTEVENELKGDLKADVLQVPHHGSAGSSGDEFIERVSPKEAVFQVGKNNYGHPSPKVIEKYQNKCIIINRNDEDGAIGFIISNGRYKKVTVIKG